jgi:hypothetical protein
MNGPIAKTDRAQPPAKVPQTRAPNNRRVRRLLLPAGLLLLAPAGGRAQSLDIWSPPHPATPSSPAASPAPSAKVEATTAPPPASPAPPPHRTAVRHSLVAPQPVPTPQPTLIATPQPAPVATVPTPKTDPIVVPDEPSPTPTAAPGDFTAVSDDMWWPLAMAATLVAALLLALGLGRMVIRRKAKAKNAAARTKAKSTAKRRKPAKPLPLPVPAEMHDASPAIAAPSVNALAGEPEPAAAVTNRSAALGERVLVEVHLPPAQPASAFKPSAQFASIPDAKPAPEVSAIAPRPADTLRFTFTPTRFSTTLANAILRYDLTLANRSDAPLGPLTITAAMDTASNDANTPHLAAMTEAHRLMLIQPGDSVSVSGELRMALSAITPLRVGGAALFVPMVRFGVRAAQVGMLADLPPVAVEAHFLVGEPQGEAGLGPFRLDTGPQTAHILTQRALVMEGLGHSASQDHFAIAASDLD